MLGYLPRDGRVYICNRDVGVMSYALSLSVIEYQTLVLRGELEAANEMLGDIPTEQKSKIARFLEGQGYKEEALDVATDDEHRFDLSLSLGKLDIALELARKADVEHKWKTVGDAALAAWQMRLAEECFTHAKDLGSLLLLYSSTNNAAGLRQLAALAQQQSAHNVAFSCLWQVGDVDGCIDLLVKTARVPEAVLFAQTYKPSRCPGLVKRWKAVLDRDGKSKVARLLGQPPGAVPASINIDAVANVADDQSLAAAAAQEAANAKVDTVDEPGDADMFPEWDEWLRLEREGGSVKLVDVESESEEEAPQEAIREAEEVVAQAEEQVVDEDAVEDAADADANANGAEDEDDDDAEKDE